MSSFYVDWVSPVHAACALCRAPSPDSVTTTVPATVQQRENVVRYFTEGKEQMSECMKAALVYERQFVEFVRQVRAGVRSALPTPIGGGGATSLLHIYCVNRFPRGGFSTHFPVLDSLGVSYSVPTRMAGFAFPVMFDMPDFVEIQPLRNNSETSGGAAFYRAFMALAKILAPDSVRANAPPDTPKSDVLLEVRRIVDHFFNLGDGPERFDPGEPVEEHLHPDCAKIADSLCDIECVLLNAVTDGETSGEFLLLQSSILTENGRRMWALALLAAHMFLGIVGRTAAGERVTGRFLIVSALGWASKDCAPAMRPVFTARSEQDCDDLKSSWQPVGTP